VKEGKPAAKDERCLYAKMPISLPKWRMTGGKLPQAYGVVKTGSLILNKDLKLPKKLARWLPKTEGQGDEEGASLDM
jgi:hypothetical protein